MDRSRRSDREAALIEAARRELLDTQASPEPAPAGPISGPATQQTRGAAPGATSPLECPAPASAAADRPDPATAMHRVAAPDAAGRVAALLQAGRDDRFRRRKRLRQYGIAIPAAVLVAALAWVVIAIWRYAKI